MIDEILADSEDRMKKTVEAVQRELAGIRTGHAHVGLVDHVRVDYFGSLLPINQMATVAAPEARLLTIQPWDRTALTAIEKALLKSDLGLTPSNDGQIIRLAIPPLNEQRRKELIKVVHTRIEDGRVAVRNVRRDALEHVKRLIQSKEASEDDQRRAQDQVQKQTDKYIASIDQLGKEKEAELMEV
ncbi:MAG: ribosome recycling factor [Dehalococcoidia bacterium]|nr:ribosome recycling factor [Dehalococcoidia bacterium]